MLDRSQAFDTQQDYDAASLGEATAGQTDVAATGRAGDAAVRRMGSANAVGGGAVGGGAAAAGGVVGAAAGVVAALPHAGDSGMITADAATKIGAADVTVPKGTVVDIKEVRGDQLVCTVWSQFGGKEAVLPSASFRAEPALAHSSDTGHTTERQGWTYQPYSSVLWNGAPTASDVAQGYLGDCYLMSAMGAVAAANPQAIQKLFTPQAPNLASYTVTLYRRDGAKLVATPVTIDTTLPTRLEDVQAQAPIYALMGKSMANHATPIWPALLEKAYAQFLGGYDRVGDKGGFAERAMEALTGVMSDSAAVPATDDAVLADFRGFQQQGKAVVCGTLDSVQAANKGGFAAAGDGLYSAQFTDAAGSPSEIVPSSFSMLDTANKAPALRDDGNGKLTSGTAGAGGTLDYGSGAPKASYTEPLRPADPATLQASFKWRGVLDKDLNVHAWHAYIFESVTADGKLIFKNPWGVQHPNPIAPADFRRLFTGINTNAVPKEAEHKAQQGPAAKS